MTTVEQAMVFLQQALDSGPISSTELRAQAGEAGISWSSVRRARANSRTIEVKRRDRTDPQSPWAWELVARTISRRAGPDEAHAAAEDAAERISRLATELADLQTQQQALRSALLGLFDKLKRNGLLWERPTW